MTVQTEIRASGDAQPAGGGNRLDASRMSAYLADGEWTGAPLGSWLDDAVAHDPTAPAALTIDADTGAIMASLTYAELREGADRLAAGLARLGVVPGHAVSVMLSNRVEFSVAAFGILRAGAIFSGIPVTYGEREASFMLRRARSKALIVVGRYRRRDLVALARSLRAQAPELMHVIVLDGVVPDEPGWHDYRELLAAAPLARRTVDSTALAHLGFTSGTTGEPKAVMNSHETIGSFVRSFANHFGGRIFERGFVNLVVSPVGHGTGLYWGALFTVYAGGTAAYLESWNPAVAVTAIRELSAAVMIGSPTFLIDLIREPGATAEQLPLLEMVCIPGGPIPRPLVGAAGDQLGCFICPAWGMTECGIAVSATPELGPDELQATDGIAIAPWEVRVVAGDDRPVSTGVEGDLQIRGPGLFLGYYDRPDFTEAAFVDGWFRTGDRATLSAHGLVTLRGRTKDIVIRGGENIPVLDVEGMLFAHPLIKEAAVLGVPDDRLGERVCAVVALQEGADIDLPTLAEFLLGEGMSKRFLPERLELLDALPKTASGKIRKVELRDWLTARTDGVSGRRAAGRVVPTTGQGASN